MKKIYFTLALLILLSSFAFAQNNYNTINEGKWGCSVAINSVDAQIGTPLQSSWGNANNNVYDYGDKIEKSYSFSIIPKYFISNDILLRFEFGITNIQIINNAYTNDVSGTDIADESISQKIYRYIPGIQWNFWKMKNIEVYCGATISYINYKVMNYSTFFENTQAPANTITLLQSSKAAYPGGFSTGVGAFAGFNIYLQKHISLGAEFSSSLLYNKTGGTYNSQGTAQIPPNTPTSINSTSSSLYKGFQFANILSSFNISLWF